MHSSTIRHYYNGKNDALPREKAAVSNKTPDGVGIIILAYNNARNANRG